MVSARADVVVSDPDRAERFVKFKINTLKGWMGERMLRRLRFALFDNVLRFPLLRFRRVKAAEISA